MPNESQQRNTPCRDSQRVEETKTGLPDGELRERIRRRRERTASCYQGGFSRVSAATEASRLLNNPYVQALVNEHLAKNAVLAELKAKEVIDGIRRNILRCEGTGESYKPFAALKGYELLGKHLKVFREGNGSWRDVRESPDYWTYPHRNQNRLKGCSLNLKTDLPCGAGRKVQKVSSPYATAVG
jgi:hypothetical protein